MEYGVCFVYSTFSIPFVEKELKVTVMQMLANNLQFMKAIIFYEFLGPVLLCQWH